jgi:hypothetical protein
MQIWYGDSVGIHMTSDLMQSRHYLQQQDITKDFGFADIIPVSGYLLRLLNLLLAARLGLFRNFAHGLSGSL